MLLALIERQSSHSGFNLQTKTTAVGPLIAGQTVDVTEPKPHTHSTVPARSLAIQSDAIDR